MRVLGFKSNIRGQPVEVTAPCVYQIIIGLDSNGNIYKRIAKNDFNIKYNNDFSSPMDAMSELQYDIEDAEDSIDAGDLFQVIIFGELMTQAV